jgi:DNA-binding XRE family transcriptional regulator
MTQNLTNTISVPEERLHVMLRSRRRELRLTQVDVARACEVTPECITHWEAGRRHMELCKIPRLASVLQLDPPQLCALFLREFHPVFYDTLFGCATSTSQSCSAQH